MNPNGMPFSILFCQEARPRSICQEAKKSQEVPIQNHILLPSRNDVSRLSREGHLSTSQPLTAQTTPCVLQSWGQGYDLKSCNQFEESVLESRRPSFCFCVVCS